MKKIIFFAVTSLLMSVPAFAQDEIVNTDDMATMDSSLDSSVDANINRPGRPGRPGRPDRGGYCTVTFKSCRLEVGGFCVKWKSRQFNVNRWDARDGCYIAQRRYGQIRSCRVSCGR